MTVGIAGVSRGAIPRAVTGSALVALLALGSLALRRAAWADCSSGGCIPGGGSPATDCYSQFLGLGLRLNVPFFDPTTTKQKPPKESRCLDGDVGCDRDGAANGTCRFNVDLCLFDDGAPGTCAPPAITAVEVSVRNTAQDASALEASVGALLPAAAPVCTSGQTVDVPVKVVSAGQRQNRAKVKVKATGADGRKDADTLRLVCVPRGWPSHGYDHANHRASPLESVVGPGNVTQLRVRWQFDAGAVTSTPTVTERVVYASSWDGRVYALRRNSGTPKWSFDAGPTVLGIQSSVTVAADGRVVFGDSNGILRCLDGKNGKVLWENPVGDLKSCANDISLFCTTDAECGAQGPCEGIDHFWSSPTVVADRVFVGVASHSDVPCTQGRLFAVDLGTGNVLWTLAMLPDRICDDATETPCTSDADCGGGSCIRPRGAGITATVAVDATGEAVYANTVGCFTFPSVGDSDSIFKIDAATGAVLWKTRVQPREQFGFCSDDTSVDCGTDAACGAGTCTPKPVYHDFGFLNGPILAAVDDGEGGAPLRVVSGSKDGTLYALSADTGQIVWKNAVLPTPVSPAFAGFGLFNGAVGFADQRFHAALYEFVPAVTPAPEHLQAFAAADGSVQWTAEIGTSWGSVALANGVLYVGTNEAAEFYAHDAATGARLATFALPDTTTSGASIVDGSLYIGYGVFGNGGVRAYALP
jgi:outer membrane protein assembly factor BamB